MVTRAVRVAPLLAAAALSLLLALWAGLARVGFAMGATPRVVIAHGPLMVVGVLGTVITIERAVAVGRAWALLAPLFALVAALGLAFGAPPVLCAWSSVASAAVLVLALFVLASRSRDLASFVIGLGSVVYLAGNTRWALGAPIFGVLPYWTTWLVLTIAGERLELTRVMRPSRFARASLVALAVALASSVALPAIVRGVVTVAIAAWLLRFDVARRVVRTPGLPRFTASTLLGGYVWLGVSGAVTAWYGELVAGPVYDAATHATMLGFVFTMVFAHAPTILPAVLGVRLPFSRVFYGHVALLHAGLVARVVGDLAGVAPLRAWGAMTNAIALLAFAFVTVLTVRSARRVTSP